MTSGTSTPAMIAARRADAAAKQAAVEQALATLVRRRAPITISAVAAHAGVSRSYLARHPTLGPKVRAASAAARPLTSPAPTPPASVESALRHHIRALQAGHADQVAGLRTRLRGLEHENAALRGELLACGRHPVTAP